MIAGFWIWKVDSIAEALEWVEKMPCFGSEESEVEIRAQEDNQRARPGAIA